MRQRLLGTFVWFWLLLVAGIARIVWLTVRAVASRPTTLLALVGLAVAFSTPNPVTAQLPLDQVWPFGHVIWSWVSPLAGAVVLFHGVNSRWVWNVRRGMRQHGW
jgi:hypothetical protein